MKLAGNVKRHRAARQRDRCAPPAAAAACSRTLRGNSGSSSRNSNAVMRQAHFAGPRRSGPSADKPRVRDRNGAARGTAAPASIQRPSAAVPRRCGFGWSPGPRRTSAAAGFPGSAWRAWSCPIPAARPSARCGRLRRPLPALASPWSARARRENRDAAVTGRGWLRSLTASKGLNCSGF